jgi:hypothetical protein
MKTPAVMVFGISHSNPRSDIVSQAASTLTLPSPAHVQHQSRRADDWLEGYGFEVK